MARRAGGHAQNDTVKKIRPSKGASLSAARKPSRKQRRK